MNGYCIVLVYFKFFFYCKFFAKFIYNMQPYTKPPVTLFIESVKYPGRIVDTIAAVCDSDSMFVCMDLYEAMGSIVFTGIAEQVVDNSSKSMPVRIDFRIF